VTRHQRLAHLKRHVFAPSNRVPEVIRGIVLPVMRRAAPARGRRTGREADPGRAGRRG